MIKKETTTEEKLIAYCDVCDARIGVIEYPTSSPQFAFCAKHKFLNPVDMTFQQHNYARNRSLEWTPEYNLQKVMQVIIAELQRQDKEMEND